MKHLFAGLLAGCMLLTGCSTGQTSAKQLKELNIVLDWYPNAIHTFLYDGIEKGYFEEEGIDLKIQFPSNANDAMSLVAAGQAEVGLYYLHDVIQARTEHNVPIRAIGTLVQYPLGIVTALADKNITKPQDLVGKTVGYAGTELSEATIKAMMEHVGADFSTVKMVDVGFDLMSSMTTGRVDATIGCLVNHEVPQMEKEGFAVTYFSPDQYGLPRYYEEVFISNDALIEKDPELLKGFLRACQKGFNDFKKDPDGTLKILLDNQDEANFALDPSVEKQSVEVLLPLMETAEAPFLSQNAEVWQQNIDWMHKQGLLSKTEPAQNYFIDLLAV